MQCIASDSFGITVSHLILYLTEVHCPQKGAQKSHEQSEYDITHPAPHCEQPATVTDVLRSRAESLAKAQSLESQGRSREARESYTKCLDITPEMAFQLIKVSTILSLTVDWSDLVDHHTQALRAENVDYVVAPYEADAQLCFLEREGFVDGIITEDSDLLVFGCDTVRVDLAVSFGEY